jgi:hypothetical protein
MSEPAGQTIKQPFQWVLEAFSPVVKRPGPEVNHSTPSSLEVKKK